MGGKKAILRGWLARHRGYVVSIGALACLAGALVGTRLAGGSPRDFFALFVVGSAFLAFAADLLGPAFLLQSLRAKGYDQLSLLEVRGLVIEFSGDSAARLPPWHDIQTLPGVRVEGRQLRSIRHVLANTLHDTRSLRDHLRWKGYVGIMDEDAWLLMNLYGNLPLLELPARGSLLKTMPGLRNEDSVEVIKSALARFHRMSREKRFDREGNEIQDKPLWEWPEGAGSEEAERSAGAVETGEADDSEAAS